MSEPLSDGGPVYPTQAFGSDGLPESSMDAGMSVRAYFAAAALQGMLARKHQYGGGLSMGQSKNPVNIARGAVEYADALLAALTTSTDGASHG